MVHQLFVVGSIWFWGLLALELGWLVYCVIREQVPYRGLISIPIFLVFLQFFTNSNILAYVWTHPISLLFLLGLFLAGGCIWVFPRWYLFVTDHHRRYRELRETFLCSKKLVSSGNIPEELKEEWESYYKSNNCFHEDRVIFKPDPKDYRERIITWMSLWPISFTWTALNMVGVRFFRTVYYHISGTLRRISDNVFKNEVQDFQKVPKPVIPYEWPGPQKENLNVGT